MDGDTGFNFRNSARNAHLAANGLPTKAARKTGTTICGAVFANGIVLGADTRATEGDIVADKNCSKIHYIADNIYCCGAGTAADTEMVTRMISSQIELHRQQMKRMPRVVTACTYLKNMLYRYQGHIGAAMVMGGVDPTGFFLYTVAPHGSSDKLPYVSMGSGSLAAMAVFESKWKPNMSREEAKKLVRDAIRGGIFNDLGSGSNVDLCVLSWDSGVAKTDYIRPHEEANQKGVRRENYLYAKGTTPLISTTVHKMAFDIVSEQIQVVPMEVA